MVRGTGVVRGGVVRVGEGLMGARREGGGIGSLNPYFFFILHCSQKI